LNGFPQEKEKRLLELLGQETEFYKRLWELSEEQAEMLALDDAEAFDKSLDRSREVIEKINGLHQETDVLMQSYTSYSVSDGGKKVEAIESAIKQNSDKIAECAKLHVTNSSVANEKAEMYISHAGKLSVRRKSLGLYTQNASAAPTMFDKKS
jgi:ElaB/YqjD/DUF883 family membrane-anchored ribosome-binding protein